ncbi:branched-chain amino acid:cation transporter, LIVCS family [Cytobacillus horneckiae]|uniref:Branched-chain amino acid transport system carrier protein n=1 Tax=Cytobacillus horneckiae TaxID=549687 RepID=A0A2N0ZIJ7_9BACI|nr:branched-chain amino acid transport system II carrier protein [Cytobacillus horneckiae]MBN6886695.1 branched-chain amino acid transport system II carrier protein [Cytobacillus horneckiae]MCM3177834.1 branched-chain amino acid transport system II carrier protein [Cytobacillus horneckiae]MEC1157360.1 branched-chain amino acid transport system II carrier protein [Cytobacillus horneckiae]MED2935759.1 branched-chain amino acid transport system II carrier protein [Cytobacillus horneckiae]PKG29345
MNQKISNSYIIAVGFMLFSLFFGAGNLIFPAMMGQEAGTNVWLATAGFIATGVGLPLLGVIALGISGKNDLQSLASRVHPMFGIAFTVILYLSIGPLFAIPRTGTVSYEIGIKPFLPESWGTIGLLVFTIIFFAITAYFSLNSSKIVDIVGKYLTPILLLFILILIGVAFMNPIGSFQAPAENYLSDSFFNGFKEGYLTMDALAAFVFGIIVIDAVRSKGAQTKKAIMISVTKAGLIAAGLLAVIYSSLAFIGASSVSGLGSLDNGGAVLSGVSSHYFGSFGGVLLSLIVLAACLTTSIGLISSCATYFTKLMPNISYNRFVIIFSVFSAGIANFGLSQLISISIPVLTAIYPLAIVLMLLTFLHPLFNGKKEVYQISMLLTFIVSLFDGLNAAGLKVSAVNDFFANILPLHSVGLGWVAPAIIGAILGIVIGLFKRGNAGEKEQEKQTI